MIKKLSLKNFKAFSNFDNLELKPITILSGKNSSGKSSILHSLLLLKQTLEADQTTEALSLDGPFLQYSNLRELTFGLPQEVSANIEYTFEIDKKNTPIGNISFEIRNRPLPNVKRKGPVVSRFRWKQVNHDSYKTINLRKYKYKWPKSENIELPPIPEKYELEKIVYIGFESFLPEFAYLEILQNEETVNKNEEKAIGFPLIFMPNLFTELIWGLKKDLSRIRYLGPSRAMPRRAYIQYATKSYDLDPDGGNAAYIYWLRKDEKISWLGNRVELKHAVNECFEMIGFDQKILPKRSSKIVYQLLVSGLNDQTKSVTIADVGFGYSQVLPIILRGLLSDDDALLLFEQPEIHLHPSSKALLADLFIAFIQSGKRLLIETHSTELINRLQYRAIQNQEVRKDINVVFIEKENDNFLNGSKIRQLSLKEDGMFTDWPEGFCDESEKLSRQILEASLKG